jgi:ABC-type ATPase with predicted acetyltransferase domain
MIRRRRRPRKRSKKLSEAVKKGLTENAVEQAVGLGLSNTPSKKKPVGKAPVAEDAQATKRA